MIALVLLVLLLTGCASLPPTNLPICGHTEQFESICRAPVLCIREVPDVMPEDPFWCEKTKEKGRDEAWEKANVCPTLQLIRDGAGPAKYGYCYEYAGARDSRQVYRRVLRKLPGA